MKPPASKTWHILKAGWIKPAHSVFGLEGAVFKVFEMMGIPLEKDRILSFQQLRSKSDR